MVKRDLAELRKKVEGIYKTITEIKVKLEEMLGKLDAAKHTGKNRG